jgi:hypothetical protein
MRSRSLHLSLAKRLVRFTSHTTINSAESGAGGGSGPLGLRSFACGHILVPLPFLADFDIGTYGVQVQLVVWNVMYYVSKSRIGFLHHWDIVVCEASIVDGARSESMTKHIRYSLPRLTHLAYFNHPKLRVAPSFSG